MKKQLLLLASVLFCVITFAQTVPQGINYQAVARDATGNELTNQALTVRLSVMSGTSTGILFWEETHLVTTNDYGLFTAVIGGGTSTGLGSSTTFDAVAWGSAAHYLKVEVDDGGGYVDMGTTQFMSVPYALQAGTSVFDFNANGTGIQAPTDVASGDYSTAMGDSTEASGYNSTTMGRYTVATGQISTAMGYQTVASGHVSTAMGGNTEASGIYSTAMGNNTLASASFSTAIGKYNFGGGSSASWIATDPIFEIGNGISGSSRSNALTVLKNGNVGIGTHTPIKGKLEISGNQQCCGTTQGDFWYYLYNNPSGQFQWYNGTDNFDISVYADGRFMGSGIHIFSDERIKDIVGLSNSKKDLSTLLSLEITDYKMKDKAKGDKPYKKVIAQQVKEVYPQAISLTTEVVPDIYAVATIKDGYVSLETDLKQGDKVRLILEDETSLFDVISVDKNGFKVSTDKSGKVFVYGREVDDFHSVDYEALSMLNVSATQELYKLILSQQKIIESLETEVAEIRTDFDERIKELEGIINTTTLNK